MAQYRSFVRLDPEAETYVEKTLQLFASWGGAGVVVLTPTQPEVLTAAQGAGWQLRHAETLRLLEQLQQQYDFAIVDMTSVSSFGGDPAGFFDATHMTTENQRKMIDAVLSQAGDAASWYRPRSETLARGRLRQRYVRLRPGDSAPVRGSGTVRTHARPVRRRGRVRA